MAGRPPIQMGPNAVSNPAQLINALKAQGPPANSKTPIERLNPEAQALEHVKSASVSLERAQNFTNDESVILVLSAMVGILNKLLLRFDGQAVTQAFVEAAQQFPMVGGPGPMGQPPPQMPGMPGMGGAPAAPQQPQPVGGLPL